MCVGGGAFPRTGLRNRREFLYTPDEGALLVSDARREGGGGGGGHNTTVRDLGPENVPSTGFIVGIIF